MLTFQESYEKAQTISGDTSSATLALLKSDINTGAHRFNAALNRYFTRRSKTTNIVADQRYYQLPPDCIRPIGLVFNQSSTRHFPLIQVQNEMEWRYLLTTNQTAGYLTHYFVRGSDEVGLYPIPSSSVSDGLELYYEVRDKDLTFADYSTGTITLTQGLTTVTGSGTVFTESMVGRAIKVTDGTDGHWYKVGAYTSSTAITLEEPYIGISGSAKTYKIGETFVFPGEYHDAPVDYALARYFEMKNNPDRATYHLARYNDSQADAKGKYASSSASGIITESAQGYNPFLVPPEPITGV